MKNAAWLLIIVLSVSVGLSAIYAYELFAGSNQSSTSEFYFGVTCGFNTTRQYEQLIDKVKNYTNLFVIDSWDVAQNETMLNEICDYAANSDLKFIVYFDLISGTSGSNVTYPWHKGWITNASTRWGDKFLGIYLHDELGGKQIDAKNFFENASDYGDAANRFVSSIAAFGSTQFAKANGIPMFMSDYALYWWDYLGGYDTVFAELGWNHSTPQQIAFVRGAANMQGKDWGAIITWKYYDPPYLGNGTEIYQDMFSAYTSGAKYVLIFNEKYYPYYPETNPYGSLTEEHFVAMKTFSDYVRTHPRSKYGVRDGSIAFVLPANYGWGARRQDEGLWGMWPPDNKTDTIWQNMNRLSDKYGLSLDIIFDDARFNPAAKYDTIYLWNDVVT